MYAEMVGEGGGKGGMQQMQKGHFDLQDESKTGSFVRAAVVVGH